MSSTSFFTADQADEYLGGTGWFPAIEGRRKWRAEFLAEFLGAALTLPSLVAEVCSATPARLFIPKSHRRVVRHRQRTVSTRKQDNRYMPF